MVEGDRSLLGRRGHRWEGVQEDRPLLGGREDPPYLSAIPDRPLFGAGALILASPVPVGISAASHGNGRSRQPSFCADMAGAYKKAEPSLVVGRRTRRQTSFGRAQEDRPLLGGREGVQEDRPLLGGRSRVDG